MANRVAHAVDQRATSVAIKQSGAVARFDEPGYSAHEVFNPSRVI